MSERRSSLWRIWVAWPVALSLALLAIAGEVADDIRERLVCWAERPR